MATGEWAAAAIPGSSATMTTDETLILEFQQGSREAFSELFLRYRDLIYAFFRRRVSDSAQAEELAQETFLALLRAASRFEARATFRAYLFGIAFKILAAHRRKSQREQRQSSDSSDVSEATAPDRPDAEAALFVKEAVDQLESAEREILMLREFEELSYEEIASLLRIPINTVRSRLFRARMALREILAAPQAAPKPRCEERT